ncbi:uncharacterized protein FOMMEDRAFT_160597 [Fomitiporia mediterranea MF3/22]|uniref:uncharacterized protein n=1 Tax=Fomitiporia mediterranea (strain MF3/22) TaxID=694068 RepID=UPI000440777F|nr:uncharacterized protein FOMMEDRAFT_160597 [Fomitiporia mediterranea MF3/22]EJC99531.1 hypothetical protein FOMMEDRAFT_160597 [Fomitiporia mediterranea MF3/22]
MEFKVLTGNNTLAILLKQIGNPSFLCILGSRLLFNLKEAGKLGINEGTNYRIKTLSNIEFEQPAGSEGSPTDNICATAEHMSLTASILQVSSV